MATPDNEFAQYCCELLSSVGPCRAKRMFGGWGISTDGLTMAILADLGQGEILWLKADETNRASYQAAQCPQFSYTAKGETKYVNYFGAPADAMESPDLMRPWARLAMEAALRAAAVKAAKAVKKTTKGKSAAKTPAKAKAKPPAKT